MSLLQKAYKDKRGGVMEDKHLIIANTFIIIAFVVLAIVFHKWWLVFVSGLFIYYRKKVE